MISLLFSLLVLVIPPAEGMHAAAPSQYSLTPRTSPHRVVVAKKKVWAGHFSAENFSAGPERLELQQTRETLKLALRSLPQDHTQALQELQVHNIHHPSRGLANSRRITLNTGNIESQEELLAVFVHEMAHVVDLGLLRGHNGAETSFKNGKQVILQDDLSYQFYRLSWVADTKKKPTAMRADFVSGYGMSDPFEDFAESYALYRLHGAEFRVLARQSTVLQKKYNFLKWEVFYGKEFQKGEIVQAPQTLWDVTLLGFEVADFASRN